MGKTARNKNEDFDIQKELNGEWRSVSKASKHHTKHKNDSLNNKCIDKQFFDSMKKDDNSIRFNETHTNKNKNKEKAKKLLEHIQNFPNEHKNDNEIPLELINKLKGTLRTIIENDCNRSDTSSESSKSDINNFSLCSSDNKSLFNPNNDEKCDNKSYEKCDNKSYEKCDNKSYEKCDNKSYEKYKKILNDDKKSKKENYLDKIITKKNVNYFDETSCKNKLLKLRENDNLLKKENKNLGDKNKELKHKIDNLSKDNKKLNHENIVINDKNKDLKENIEVIVKDNKKLNHNNGNLIEKNKDLKDKVEDLIDDNKKITNEYEELQNKYKHLLTKLKTCEQDMQILSKKLAESQKEKEELKKQLCEKITLSLNLLRQYLHLKWYINKLC